MTAFMTLIIVAVMYAFVFTMALIGGAFVVVQLFKRWRDRE